LSTEIPEPECSDPFDDALERDCSICLGPCSDDDDWGDEDEIDIAYIEVDGKTVVSLNGQGHLPLDCE
jgi:hypothetical protein